tara:strand:+ start:826 stop:1629 length:804 start_codon:yes stop_codon:yes gene_type:complete
MSKAKILFIGCGNMGGSIVSAIDSHDFDISVLKPTSPSPHLKSHIHQYYQSPDQINQTFDCVVLAVKPQKLSEVGSDVSHLLDSHTLILSIMAGTKSDHIASFLGNPNLPVIRIMPNLPVSVGEGISTGFANSHINARHKDIASRLFKNTGELVWLNNEVQMDAATALAGSGPAYFFLTVEALTSAGVNAGLPEKTAEMLARQTLTGAGQLLKKHKNISATNYRRQVTSPGGTTEAAVDSLFNSELPRIYLEAVKSAIKRAQDLAKG